MSRSIRLLVVLVFLLLLSACAPALQSPPVVPPTATPAEILPVLPTAAPQLTPTVALETPVVVPTFQLSSACMLTSVQRSHLESVSRKWLAETDAAALQVARDLDYIGINGQPSTMCGPLSVAILQDAGLADPYFDRANFYLLNPRPGFGDGFVESFFPASRYFKLVEERVIKEVDYAAEPLCPGDFLYLFAGESGSYDHMIVVTRVDEVGRAYTVTNIDWGDGFRVEELMLYDPAQPGVGMFTNWTSRPHPQVGRTGYDGFWLWRLKASIADPTPAATELVEAIDRIIDQAGGVWHVQLKEVGGGVIYSRLADTTDYPSPFIKLADAVLFLNLLENKVISDLPAYLLNNGTDSRTFDQLLRAMLIQSDENATASIENWISQYGDPNLSIQELGFKNTFIAPRQSTTAEMADMLEQLYLGSLLSEGSTAYLLSLLAESTPSSEVLTGVIRSSLAYGNTLYDLRGSPLNFPVAGADLALVDLNGKAYTLAFFANPSLGGASTNSAQLASAIEEISLLFLEYLQSQ